MFEALGQAIARHPWQLIGAWAVFIVLLVSFSPSRDDLHRVEPKSLLPADQPYNLALELERRAFPNLASRTRTVLVFEAEGGLTTEHVHYLTHISQTLSEQAPENSQTIQSAQLNPMIAPRLLSSDGQSAMIVINSDSNYLTQRSVDQVESVDRCVRRDLPDDLHFEITGEGGMGRDLVTVSQEAFRRTTKVTLVALVVILGLVYRAPIAATLPLVAIGASVVAALYALAHMTRLGWGVSAFEKTLVVVLLFGSGTDYALFWIAAFRERVSATDAVAAAASATADVGPAILASAATTIGGLLMLTFADLLPSSNAGRSLALALAISLVAALTLLPAIAVLVHHPLFWPRSSKKRSPQTPSVNGVWSWVGRIVATRGRTVAVMLGLVMVFFAYYGVNASYTYDALGVIPEGTSTARGRSILDRHFKSEQLFSWNLLIQSDAIEENLDRASEWAAELQSRIKDVDGIVDVWSFAAPLGRSSLSGIAAEWARDQSVLYYVSTDHHTMRLEILQDAGALSKRAMGACESALRVANEWTKDRLGNDAAVQATGLTPYIINVRDVADADHWRVVILVIAAILIIVSLLLRHAGFAVLILGGTLLAYLMTVGLVSLFFENVFGSSGIDWKVRLFSFVILVAVGQDYGIYIVTRIMRERRHHGVPVAARNAVISSGAVVTSCGLIMAATMGSLGATGLSFFQQLGLAFGVGVMVDAVLVCAIFVPAVYVAIGSRRDESALSE